MSREERDYVDPPMKVEVGSEKREDPEAIAEEDSIPVERPESERDRIAREYHEKKQAEIEGKAHKVGPAAALQADEAEPMEEDDGNDIDEDDAEQAAPEMVEIKVDGETRMVDKSVVDNAGGVRAYQKELAADKRLRQAAEVERALNARIQQLEDHERRMSGQHPQPAEPGQPQNTDPSNDGPSREEIARKALQAMYDGDEDTAAQYLADLAKPGPAPQAPISRDELVQEAARVLDWNQYQRDKAEGQEDFRNDYPEIMKDPVLLNDANELTKSLANEHPNWRPQRVMKEAGKRVRAREKAKARAAGGTTEEKLEAKRNQTNLGQHTGRDNKPAPTPPQIQSNSEYVQSLAKQRGLIQ